MTSLSFRTHFGSNNTAPSTHTHTHTRTNTYFKTHLPGNENYTSTTSILHFHSLAPFLCLLYLHHTFNIITSHAFNPLFLHFILTLWSWHPPIFFHARVALESSTKPNMTLESSSSDNATPPPPPPSASRHLLRLDLLLLLLLLLGWWGRREGVHGGLLQARWREIRCLFHGHGGW